MKNLQKYWSTSLLVKLSIVTALVFLCLEVNVPRTQTSAAAPLVSSKISSVIPEEGSATLSPANLKTWEHFYDWWHSELPYCDRPGAFEVRPAPEDITGSMVAGFKHRYDKGAVVFGCPDGSNTVYRGTVWFDLSDIISKAPPLHVVVKSATLHFKNLSGECPGELLVGTADWMKGYADNTLVPGDPFAKVGSCGSEGCSVDVQAVVNNWVRGEEHGYANYGFVFKGIAEADLKYGDNDSCIARYGDFSLTVTYQYNKEPAAKMPESYPLVCRGTDSLKVIDLGGPAGFRWVGFNFIPGTNAAKDGLLPGQCSWLDRGMRPGEPARLAQPIEGIGVWSKELNSSDSYWTFNVYNAGAQLQATGAERSKKTGIDVAKPGVSLPVGGLTLARTNVALASEGGVASASSTTAPWVPAYVNDGDPTTDVDRGVWLDGTYNAFPDWIQIDFKGAKSINEIVVVTRQDDLKSTAKPPETLTFDLSGITDFDVQYWDGKWITVPGGSVTGNNLVWRRFNFPKVKTDKIRLLINGSKDKAYSRIVELEAWGN